MSEAGVCVDGRLDDELAASLEPKLQGALNHPARREILRFLHGARRGCCLTEMVGELAPLTRGQVSYHVLVLRDSGSVFVDGFRPATREREALYRSALVDDAGTCAALGATARSDRERREAARRSNSSSLLSMFKVPRPTRTIRLGERAGRKTKPGE